MHTSAKSNSLLLEVTFTQCLLYCHAYYFNKEGLAISLVILELVYTLFTRVTPIKQNERRPALIKLIVITHIMHKMLRLPLTGNGTSETQAFSGQKAIVTWIRSAICFVFLHFGFPKRVSPRGIRTLQCEEKRYMNLHKRMKDLIWNQVSSTVYGYVNSWIICNTHPTGI